MKSIKNRVARFLLYGVGLLVVLCYTELNVLQIFRPTGDDLKMIYDAAGSVIILSLIIPFFAFVVLPFIDYCYYISNSRPIWVKIDKNTVSAKRLDCVGVSHKCVGKFSQKEELISDAEKLAECIQETLNACCKGFIVRPYIVFTATERLSPVQSKAVIQAVLSFGASDIKYIEMCLSDSDALAFVRKNPTVFNF